jgi:hypothetical protein
MRRVMRALREFDWTWVGDAIGAASLFVLLWLMLLAGAVLS